MKLPKVIADLVAAQNSFDSVAYANCFSDTAIVHDEGKTHTGRKDIQQWIAKANNEYKATMKPVAYSETKQTLQAETSGNFPGSPVVLTYQLKLKDGLIEGLRIVG